MITAHFYLHGGGQQVIKMSHVPASEVQSVCNALKHDLNADHYEYYVLK